MTDDTSEPRVAETLAEMRADRDAVHAERQAIRTKLAKMAADDRTDERETVAFSLIMASILIAFIAAVILIHAATGGAF